MSKFKKNEGKSAPAINTSSLPDIVFMLLFFFMVATTTKDIDPMVRINNATGVGLTDLTPYKQRSEVDFVYLGKPIVGDASKFDKGVAVQYDGILGNIDKIDEWKSDKYSQKPKGFATPKEKVVTCFKVDEQVPVGILFDAKKELQNADFNTIAYHAAERGNNNGYSIDNN
ncbi:biopolymer transporter ExbD [Lishizhenia sp.]|uniref:ExbD/TolR family protein n=1 Tax=Lishizhenia sp. TaxID=2497594 RepID=UPI00299D3CEA|nr:biopolymer transporter ExbD [Lishizhenia sp.]MDX1445954.1 biopolymer transporter ExbD [Lishizhenia sp.]